MLTLYIDTETTGLNPTKNGIIQLAYIIEKDGKVLRRGSYKINPNSYNKEIKISEEALKINGYKEEDFDSFSNAEDVVKELIKILSKYKSPYSKEKYKLIAYNARFDLNFLIALFNDVKKDYELKLFIDFRAIDPFELFKYLVYSGKLELEGYSMNLEAACKAVGLEFDAHDAVADIEATRELHYRLLEICNGKWYT